MHQDFDNFLHRVVDSEGRVDYARAATDRADLDRYVTWLAATSPDSHPERFGTPAGRLAYWINAYNASAIAIVLEHFPINSVHDVRPPFLLRLLPRGAGFFLFQRVILGGHSVTLYGLENQVVRKRFADPRVHFALNCASLGCPKLPRRAFTAQELDQQLSRETERFLAESRNLTFDRAKCELHLSAIFEWYRADFTSWVEENVPNVDASLREYVVQHLQDRQLAEKIGEFDDCRKRSIPYDWTLNDIRFSR